MAATPKDSKKQRLDSFNVDKGVYDLFIRNCSGKGFAPQTIMERLMKKYNDTGQI